MKKTNGLKNIFIINDTRRDSAHLGCKIVMQNLLKLCDKYNFNILGLEKNISEDFDKEDFKNKINNVDFIIVNGEGTLHDNAGEGIYSRVKIAKDLKKSVFLINAVWQNNNLTKNI